MRNSFPRATLLPIVGDIPTIKNLPMLHRIITAHRDYILNDTSITIRPTELYMSIIPPKANPPNFLPLETVFHFIKCGL